MHVWLNGEFVPEERALVSVFDRGFLYGDGLFETLRVQAGRPFRWRQHFERLQNGATFLGLAPLYSCTALEDLAKELSRRNGLPDCVLRITLSRGTGVRGYSPRGSGTPTLVMSLHPAPEFAGASPSLKLVTSTIRLHAGDPLSAFKTANKLPQILARAEADRANADEALLLNMDGDVVEATASNVFWIEGESIGTPPVSSGALPGVTRATFLELCGKLGIQTREAPLTLGLMRSAEGVFLTNSVSGIVEAAWLDGLPLKRSPLVARLQSAYAELVQAECR